MLRTSDERYARVIEACNACANVCEWCASTSLPQIEAPSMGRCISLSIDCAEVCRLTASLLLRGSPLASAACMSCIEACEMCLEECERAQGLHFERCADRCAQCIEACWTLVSQGIEPEGRDSRAKATPARH